MASRLLAEDELIGRSPEGKLIVRNKDGSVSHERTITIGVDGGFLNIPTMFRGKKFSADEAVRIMRLNQWTDPDTGIKPKLFKTEAEAVKAAQDKEKENQTDPKLQPRKRLWEY